MGDRGALKKLKCSRKTSCESSSSSLSEMAARPGVVERSPQSGKVAWGEEGKEVENLKESGMKKRRRKKKKVRGSVDSAEVVRQTWRRGETSPSGSSCRRGNSRENGRDFVEKDGAVDASEDEQEEKDAGHEEVADDLKELNATTETSQRRLRLKRSFATTGDSSSEEMVEIETKEEEESCKEEGSSRMLGGSFERALVHHCSDQELFGEEILATCSDGDVKEDGDGGPASTSDLEEDNTNSNCSRGSGNRIASNDVTPRGEKEEDIFDPPSTEILDYRSILSALKEKHRKEQRKLEQQLSSDIFWAPPGSYQRWLQKFPNAPKHPFRATRHVTCSPRRTRGPQPR